MRFARFLVGSETHVGLIQADQVIDLTARMGIVEMTELMARWFADRAGLEALLNERADYQLSAVRLLSPVERPGKIFAMGLNYADHCAEAGIPEPEHQTWFTKAGSSVTGPFDALELPVVSEQLDYEAEMVAVIGRRCRNVSRERAAEVIFGYCVGNDVSVRDWQLLTQQWSLGKSFDKSAPIGPWITTGDGFDPHKLGIRLFVNGERRQNSNTKHLLFNAFDMVAYLSQAMTLEPGDLIFTGTPGGVGLLWEGGPAFLRAGDVVRVELDELGAIENPVQPGSGETMIA